MPEPTATMRIEDRCGICELEELAQERKRKEHNVGHEQRSTEEGHPTRTPGPRSLEGEDEVQADHDQRGGGRRAGLHEAEVEDVERDEVRGENTEPRGHSRGD